MLSDDRKRALSEPFALKCYGSRIVGLGRSAAIDGEMGDYGLFKTLDKLNASGFVIRPADHRFKPIKVAYCDFCVVAGSEV
jgi:hypothetical protein